MPENAYFKGAGNRVMKAMQNRYGKAQGKRVFYATANKTNMKPGTKTNRSKIKSGPRAGSTYGGLTHRIPDFGDLEAAGWPPNVAVRDNVKSAEDTPKFRDPDSPTDIGAAASGVIPGIVSGS